MTDISKALRSKLAEEFRISNLKIAEVFRSSEDNTTKYLFDIGNNTCLLYTSRCV